MRAFWSGMVVAMLAVAPLRAETLADALIAAYRNSNLLEQNQAILRAADEDAAVALANLRPIVDFTTRATFNRQQSSRFIGAGTTTTEDLSGSIGLSSSVLIWGGGRNRLGVAVARESVLSTRAGLVNVEQQVLLDAVSAYVEVRLQAEFVALRQSNVRLIAQQLQAARDRFEVGEVTLTNVAEAESRLAAAQAGLAAAIGDQTVAREQYKVAVGVYPRNLAGLPQPPATARTVEDARAVGLRTHPNVIRAQHEVRVAELRADLARATLGPTLTGNLSTGITFDGDDSSSVGLVFNQRLYGGGELSALYRRALAGKAAASAVLQQTGLTIGENIGSTWARIIAAQAAIEAGRLQVAAAQTAFEGVREEALLGARTTLDVLDNEQTLLDARANKLQAEANRYVFTYQLLAAMGLLTADHLKLGIPTFDPEAYYNAVKNAPATSAQGKRLDRVLERIGK